MSRPVIVVDDEISFARNLSRYLARYDFHVHKATSLSTAELLLDRHPDALLYLDICLPDGDGLAFLSRRRARGDNRPCLLVSAHVSDDSRARALELDAEIVEKPTPLSRLRERADALLRDDRARPTASGMRRRRGPVVLMYSHDGYGLGHMRRNLNIARSLVANDPTTDVLMIIGCPSGLFFELPPQIDFIKLPSIVKTGQERWEPSKLSMSFDAACSLRAGMILHTAKMLRPDVLMVDYLAQGVGGELQPTLDWLRNAGSDCKTVLGLRDIIDDPQQVQARWQQQGIRDRIVSSYDRVLLYGDAGMFDSAEAYGLKKRIRSRLRYCGYVAPILAQRQVGRNPVPRIVVTAGGGRDGLALQELAIRAKRQLAERRIEMTLVTGPLMEPADRQRLNDLAGGDPEIRLLSWVESISDLTRCADLVMTMAGYNSLTEILAQGHRPLVMPRRGPSQEQRIRTRLFAERDLLDELDPENVDEFGLAELVGSRLDKADCLPPIETLPFDGANVAARELAMLMPAKTAIEETVS